LFSADQGARQHGPSGEVRRPVRRGIHCHDNRVYSQSNRRIREILKEHRGFWEPPVKVLEWDRNGK
jgi:hypothetical protein